MRVCYVAPVLICSCLIASGCPPRVVVRPNPGEHTKGIRYYRPKPYLLVTPSGATATVTESTTTTPPGDSGNTVEVKRTTEATAISQQYVTLKLEYLPDFSEEYAIDVRTGVGTADVQITLEDGWKLTSLNQDLDSNFDENVDAIANLVSAVAPTISGNAVGAQADHSPGSCNVKATNVPIGYYESVVSRDPCTGKKRLYGWRYVGFMPYAMCPVEGCGHQTSFCSDQCSQALYGLVFVDGCMTFKELGKIANIGIGENLTPACAQPVTFSEGDASNESTSETDTGFAPLPLFR